jgi:hypothetical protein
LTVGVGKIFHPEDYDQEDVNNSWTSFGGYNGSDECPDSSFKGVGGSCPVPDGYDHTFPDNVTLYVGFEYLEEAATSSDDFFLSLGFVKPHSPFVYPASFEDNIPADMDMSLATNQYIPAGGGPEANSYYVKSGTQEQFCVTGNELDLKETFETTTSTRAQRDYLVAGRTTVLAKP